jgi:hypothetical protein
LVLFSLALVFILSLAGGRLLRADTAQSETLILTVKAVKCDNAVARALDGGECVATLDGALASLLSYRSEPSPISEQANGVFYRYPSELFSDIYFTLSVDAAVREGVYYADGVFLSLGKHATLSSPLFYGNVEIVALEVGQSTQKTAENAL